MILLRKIGIKLSKTGKSYSSYGIFKCLYCLQEVERTLSHGRICKSCGCMMSEFLSKIHKGKKLTEEHKLKFSRKGKKQSKESIEKRVKKLKGKKRTEEQRHKMSESHIGFKPTKETKQKQSLKKKGKNNPNWNDGISFEPYSYEFNKDLKQLILERDNYTCQNPNCGYISIKLDAHHIDYNKKNNNQGNLVTLCAICHGNTNGNRDYYTGFYQNIMNKKLIDILA